MSETKVDAGGFVYPCQRMEKIELADGSGAESIDVEYPGITRRDALADDIASNMYLAYEICKIIAPMINHEIKNGRQWLSKVPEVSYARADAMIAEGRKE